MREISNDKNLYIGFCENHEVPLFAEPWWLDIVTEGEWQVLLSLKGNNIEASWVYFQRKKFGLSYIGMPKFSPYQGPFINYPDQQKKSRRIAFEKEVLTYLIDHMPNFAYFNQRFSPEFSNWLPLYWKGFEQTTRYTYVLPDISDPSHLWDSLQSRLRRAIRKAKNRYNLSVEESTKPEEFHRLHEMTYERQNKEVPCSLQFFSKLYHTAKDLGRGEILLAYDQDGDIHAGVFIVWDKRTAYYLMGGADPSLRNSGASSLLLWEAINRQSGKREAFDFEGSMIESIEKIFRSFGAEQTPYYRIRKTLGVLSPLKLFIN
ncbi:MAG TPA: GNAT family N-acetyltransferase [bacterium]|nr:GNAT family N-acetyltransferase [bacterium]